jgi:hypothetical protein
MEHAPIYRSTAHRITTTSTSLIPWRRTASLASAVAALTMSGIALGYHGFASTTPTAVPTTEATTALDAQASARSMGAPVPGISLAIADGGHPDVISTLSSTLIAQFQAAQVPLLSLAIGPLVLPIVVAPPQPTAEPFVLPAIALGPIAEPTETPVDTTMAPSADATAADAVAPTTEDVVASDVSFALFATAEARSQAAVTVAAPGDAAATADAPQADPPADPQDQVAAEVVPLSDPTSAPAPAAPKSAPPAPVRVATPVPVVRKPTPVPVKLDPIPDNDPAPQVQLKRSPPPPEPLAAPARASSSDNQGHTTPAHASDPKASDKPGNGKGGGSNHGG